MSIWQAPLVTHTLLGVHKYWNSGLIRKLTTLHHRFCLRTLLDVHLVRQPFVCAGDGHAECP